MSKRTRGTRSAQHRRPGSRPTSARPALRQREKATGVSDQPDVLGPEVAGGEPAAAETGTSAEARPNAQLASTSPRANRATHARQRIKPGSLLATRAANEYVYVAQDLKRIVLVGALLFGALIVLWLLIVVLRVIELPFY